ncbi:hypothetical protein [Sulfuricaulis sp.]|jgi:hypothetical protein|uniref:hypothetical protein n=1 Tax=Sulfuricaulis sp. TaxID=2003553 RepID=UPI00355AAC83
MSENDTFHKAFRGTFSSLLRWQQLDEFWNVVRRNAGAGWYLYAIGAPVPAHQSSAEDVVKFIAEIDKLLHSEHHEDYCGIVYTDSMEAPTLIKIFDPNNLGVSCGFSNNPPLPGWVMSLIPPQPIESRRPLPASRQRWWQTLWT